VSNGCFFKQRQTSIFQSHRQSRVERTKAVTKHVPLDNNRVCIRWILSVYTYRKTRFYIRLFSK